MAKVPDGSFKDWQDTQTINALEYKRERELLRVAVNDNDDRISALKTTTDALGLGNVQLAKITSDSGNVKISIGSTSGNVLSEIMGAGIGFHTFYAVGGSQSLPPSGLSIRGFAHITGVSPYHGYAQATDYKGHVYTNYVINSVWTGWKEVFGYTDQGATVTALNTATDNGFFYVNPDATNSPTGNAGNLIVMALDWQKNIISQIFIDISDGSIHSRSRNGISWGSWSSTQSQLWSATDGFYMIASQTVTPSKKLSQCRNGWILVWSDYDPGVSANDSDVSYSYIPKGTPFRAGYQHLFSVPNYASSTSAGVIVKRIRVYDDRLVGFDENGSSTTSANDVVLRAVLEW